MRGFVLGLAFFVAGIGTVMAAKSSKEDLVFIGRVTSITSADTGNPLRHWLVSTSVDNVLSGELASAAFEFAIHSPARAGLKVGKTYTIPAHWTGEGYLVDELDLWRRNHR